MKHKRMVLRATLLLAAGVLSLAPPTQAQLATSVTYWTTTPVSTNTQTAWSSTLVFAKFNPTLGHLSEVDYDISSGMNTRFTVSNLGAARETSTVYDELTLTVTDPANAFAPDTPQIDKYFPSSHYSVILNPGQSATSAVYSVKVDSGLFAYTATDVLDEFTGFGTIALNATAASQWWGSSTGDATISELSHAGATGYVTYIYTIPEPKTIAILGLAGLAFFHRRRRRNRITRQPHGVGCGVA